MPTAATEPSPAPAAAPAPIAIGPGERLRLATAADNADLLKLFQSVPMRGELVLCTERSPDFFALYRQQRGTHECWALEKDGRVRGCGTVLLRDGWIDGERRRVAYLGDLRAGPGGRGALHRSYAPLLQSVAERHAVTHFYTAVLASNQAALHALTRRSPRRATQPIYHLFRRYDAVQIHFTRPRWSAPSKHAVRTATRSDLPALTQLLDRDHRERPYGYCFDQGELEHRLLHWPGYSLDSTYLAHDSEGQLAAAATVWDAAPVKRYRVEQYRGTMRWVRRLFGLSSTLWRHAPLPAPGECFRYAYLANLSVPSGDPRALRALLDRAYRDHRRRGLHFLMLYLEANSPLAPALGGFTTQRLPFLQYEVTPADAQAPPARPGTSGFEIALA